MYFCLLFYFIFTILYFIYFYIFFSHPPSQTTLLVSNLYDRVIEGAIYRLSEDAESNEDDDDNTSSSCNSLKSLQSANTVLIAISIILSLLIIGFSYVIYNQTFIFQDFFLFLFCKGSSTKNYKSYDNLLANENNKRPLLNTGIDDA